ncbi:sigma-54-dependent Fis family transcriptional regulator [Persephonella atlantica]|uniref:Sigma-54-dependent Fis family transcriptional regulator n=1 Tax=Persephonella atlantica TaxID=2699429 RepID=A0ABS1GG46_9AQUI|nr:sigma-54 dependent transcriptional regulator [Persephonella atlantica]MBK3331892.1 sigma-54-dependent Fis family transcriptional regulator [Persephonella atlantica]
MEKGRIMIVDDEEDILLSFKMILEDEGYMVETVSDPLDALEILKRKEFDLVLSDMRMPKMSGEEFLVNLRKFNRITTFIVMTAYGTIDNAVRCMKEGAFHYITKPVDFNDPSIWKLIEEGVEKARILRENQRLRQELEISRSDVDFIITKNPSMNSVIEFVKKVAPFDNTILIYGESGVGKELIAQAIHRLSPRKDRPFIAVNCANISGELMEAEFFGYKKGSFTGATEDKMGILEKANGGTVFLDEIGEIPYDLQAKFLRFLEEKEIRKIGDDRPVKLDVRVITATNRDLKKMVEEGRFRKDLYYRIGGFKIEIPPLRERKDDIPLLVNHFIQKYNRKYNKDIIGITPEALETLIKYNWPGNVRQLESIISKAIILADDGQFIEEKHLDPEIKVSVDEFPLEYSKAKKNYTEKFMKTYLSVLLSITGGNISQAAKIAKIERQSLQKLLKKYQVDPSKYRKY